MYNCFDISREILKLAKKEGLFVDPMKLLKLVYITHGYYLGFNDKPLIKNQVQAWKFGPVIPELYHVIKRFGSGNVDFSTIDLYAENELSDSDKKFVELVWNAYKKNDGLQLSSMTHKEGTPWDKVYRPEESHRVIDNYIIEDYYKNLIDERAKTISTK